MITSSPITTAEAIGRGASTRATGGLTMRLPFNMSIHGLPSPNPAEEIEKYRQMVAANPDDGIAHLMLASWLHTAGFAEEGVEEYREAIRLLPLQAREPAQGHNARMLALAHKLLAQAFQEKGQIEAAVPHWQQSLALHERLYPNRWPYNSDAKWLRKTLTRYSSRSTGNKVP